MAAMKLITWKHRLAIFGTTILMIGVFSLIGYGIGRFVGNWKLFLIGGILVSYPLTQALFLWNFNRTRANKTDKSTDV